MRKIKILSLIAVSVITAILSACASQAVYRNSQSPLKAHSSVELNRYLGKWYEIEHIEAPFEPNLKCTTAVYTQQNATQIKVDNQGISA
jgi:apolipoprotein D and lipocalin family protein